MFICLAAILNRNIRLFCILIRQETDSRDWDMGPKTHSLRPLSNKDERNYSFGNYKAQTSKLCFNLRRRLA